MGVDSTVFIQTREDREWDTPIVRFAGRAYHWERIFGDFSWPRTVYWDELHTLRNDELWDGQVRSSAIYKVAKALGVMYGKRNVRLIFKKDA